jgi:putative intracellular protease/amidase
MPSVLFVYTNADKTLSGQQTGWYLPEAAHPYYVLAPHTSIDFASPNGPNPPVDEGSVAAFAKDADSVKFLSDETVKAKFSSAKKLSEVDVKAYDAVFYVGGHGPVLDLASDPVNAKLVSEVSSAVLDIPHCTNSTGSSGKLERLFRPFAMARPLLLAV